MRITKEAANNAARKLVEKKREKIKNAKAEFAETVRNMYLATVPPDVRELFDRDSGWIGKTSSIRLNSHGFINHYVNIDGSVPRKLNHNTDLEMSANDGSLLQRRFQKFSKLQKETDQLELTIKEAIYGLRTIKNVEIEFPEAIPFLPVHHTTALSVNIGPIRELLKQD